MAKAKTNTTGRDLDAEDLVDMHLETALSLVRVISAAKGADADDLRRSLEMVDYTLDRASVGWEGVKAVLDRSYPPNLTSSPRAVKTALAALSGGKSRPKRKAPVAALSDDAGTTSLGSVAGAAE